MLLYSMVCYGIYGMLYMVYMVNMVWYSMGWDGWVEMVLLFGVP
jgi:hypothetical protein